MADRAIINASPLIFFSRSHHLQLLRAYAKEFWVPEGSSSPGPAVSVELPPVRAVEANQYMPGAATMEGRVYSPPCIRTSAPAA